MSREVKAHILAWRQNKVPFREISRCTGRAKSTVMLAAAHDSLLNVVPPTILYSWCPSKTSKTTDKFLWKELHNPCLTASQLKSKSSNPARIHIHLLQPTLSSEGPLATHLTCCTQTSINKAYKESLTGCCQEIHPLDSWWLEESHVVWWVSIPMH